MLKTTRVLGLMSGTSLDGLDACLVDFYFDKKSYKYDIINTKFIPYDSLWEEKLKNAHKFSAADLFALDYDYGIFLGEKVQELVEESNFEHIEIVSSHGHTIFHQPDRHFTCQIGHGAAISSFCKLPVVCDFRSQDVAKGGQGAPLVPMGDRHLFSAYESCVNLGGIANISLTQNNITTAFDICPANIVLNQFAQKLGFKYDDKGDIAQSGNVNSSLLDDLNLIKYYHLQPPKTLGREWIEKEIDTIVEKYKLLPQDLLATFVEHISIQIANILNQNNIEKVLFSGGGTFNNFLIQNIQEKSSAQIIIPNKEIINFKEALIFGFLGYLKINGLENILATVTGASSNSSSGILYLP